MWAALKSDLQEFVHTVAEESSTALSAIDSQLIGDEPRPQNDDNNEVVMDEEGNVLYDGNIEPPLIDLILDVYCSANVNFDEENLYNILNENEDVKTCFGELVPNKMEIEEFYSRLIMLQEQRDDDKPANVLKSMQNLVEEAVRAVAPFNQVGRPPFVMNTAVDEDVGSEDGKSNQKEMCSNENKRSEMKLIMSQVEAERDVLHQTIQMQKNELKMMQEEKMKDKRLDEMQSLLNNKDKELECMKENIKEEDHKKILERITEIEVSLSNNEEELARKNEDLEVLKGQNDEYDLVITKLNEELRIARLEIMELQKNLDKATIIQDEFEALKKQLEDSNTTDTKVKEEDGTSSPSVCSSVANVSNDEATAQLKVDDNINDDDDDDDWGDAWGDDPDDV